MSGAENPEGFQWFVSFGNVLSIIISVSVVVGAIITLVRYLRKNVTQEVVALKERVHTDMGDMKEKFNEHKTVMDRGFANAKERMEELKTQINLMEHRLEQNRQELMHQVEANKSDTDKRLEQRSEETAKLLEKLDELREEYHRLSLRISMSFKQKEQKGPNHGDNELYW